MLSMILLPALLAPAQADNPPDLVAIQQTARQYIELNQQQMLDQFSDLLSIPNVASDLPNIRRNARHIVGLMESAGFDMQLLEVEGAPPVVFGELNAGAEQTVMVYVHYDGQPVQPELWSSDPWTPTLRTDLVERGGVTVPPEAPFDPEWRLFGRSAGDDKAPVIAIAHALAAMSRSGVQPSVNIKLFFDGEEEAGSPHLAQFLDRYEHLLGADLWLFCDGPVHQTRRLQLAYGVRGHVGFNLRVYGPLRPLHSGHYGNWAPNPIADLTHLLASMRGPDGRALIDGFYEQVRAPTPAELSALDRIPRVDITMRQELALGRTEVPEQRLERRLLEPALNFRGIQAGGTGEGSRNIILPSADASVEIRLVPDQTPAAIREAVERHIREQGYELVETEPTPEQRQAQPRLARIDWGDGYPAYRSDMTQPLVARLGQLMDEMTSGELVRLPTMGGSLPLYIIGERMGAPIVILPVANHDNNQHGRDENLRLQNLWDAVEIYAMVFSMMGRLDGGP